MPSPRRIVLKFGSGILARARGSGLDEKQFKRLTAEIAGLVRKGHQCVVVSSGAVAAGLGVLHFVWRVKRDDTEPILYGLVLLTLLTMRFKSKRGAR